MKLATMDTSVSLVHSGIDWIKTTSIPHDVMHVLFCHYIDLVSCLLDSGANVNDCGGIHCGGISPLMDAASSGHMDIVQLLVLRGADIFHKDIKVYPLFVTYVGTCLFVI